VSELLSEVEHYTRLYCGFDSAIEIFDVNRPGEGTRLFTSPNKKSRDGMKGELSMMNYIAIYMISTYALHQPIFKSFIP